MSALAALLKKAPAASARERAIILAGLAVVSALLTSYAGDDPWRVLAVSFDKELPTSILPGIYFGLVLGAAVYLWTPKNAFNVFAVLVVTIVAWIVAHQTAIAIFRHHEALARHSHELIVQQYSVAIGQYRDLLAGLIAADKLPTFPLPTIQNTPYPYWAAIAGAIAGLVGSAITAFGVSIASAEFRSVENWLRTLVIGTAAGVLLYRPDLKIFPSFAIVPLFIVWQTAVAASIGYGLAKTPARAQG